MLHLKIKLLNFKPSTYRIIVVKDNISFFELHSYIQDIFGFGNSHLFDFVIDGDIYIQYPGYMNDTQNGLGVSMWDGLDIYTDHIDNPIVYSSENTIILDIRDCIQKLVYTYDYGDNRVFEISKIKKKEGKKYEFDIHSDTKEVVLVDTKGVNLVDDIGGVYALRQMLDDHLAGRFDQDLFESKGDFDEFIAKINKKIDCKKFVFGNPDDKLKDFLKISK